ncbi:MAG: tetratricopeptide repeat protein [Bacteroidetes bacterium]|nr:tetratricopeptide repeat protein [Bacteroidota bacterium]
MRFISHTLLLIVLLASGTFAYSQNNQPAIDSLENLLKQTKPEKSIFILGKLSKLYHTVDLNKSLNYAGKALEISKQENDQELIAYSNMYIGDVYFEMSRFQPAIEFYEKALDYFYEQRAPENKIYIYTKLGHSEKMLSNYNNALFYYQKPLNLYLAEEDNKISEAYNNIGIIYKLQGQFRESLNYHEKALNASNLAFDQKEIANTLNYIGSLYWNNSQYDSSLFYFEKSLDIFRELEDTLGESNILSNIGTVYKDVGEYKKALDYNSKALELRTNLGNRKLIASSYNHIGSIYLVNNDTDNALEFYLTSLKIRESIQDILGIAQSQTNIALVYKKLNKLSESLDYLNKSLNNYLNIGNRSYIANTINQIGNTQKKLNKFDLALQSYLEALKIYKELNNKNKIASILNNIGIIYDNIDNFNKALESYSNALEIKREIGDKKEIAYSLHIIGNTYLKLKKYNEALDYYNQALELRIEVGDKISIANSYKSIGNTLLELNEYDRSIDNLKKALELRENMGDMKGVSDILNDIGNFYAKINNNSKAIEYYLKTIEYCNNTNDQYLKALCLRKVGVIRLESGLEMKGIDNINQSLNIGQNINNLELIKNAYYELYKHYNKQGNKSKALDNYLNYTIVKDSINAKLNSQRLVEIQMNFELEQSYSELSRIEDEVSQLTAENKIRELELKKQKNVRNLLALIVLITLVSGGLFLSQYLSKRKTNILLQEKIEEVDKSNTLLKESEDNLKILNATKDKFFSIIAHDLRNPFNALHGLTQHLLNNYDNFDSEEIKESIEIIYNSADDLLELLENLLHWSRTQRGKMKFTPVEVNISEIITKIFNLLKMNAEKKDINLINEIDQEKTIVGDKDMLTAILRNLISNAIKFSHTNSFIRVSSKDYKDYTEFSVMDNGVGISPENIKKLFRIDVHHSTTGTSDEQGSGLGLILCREFVEKHNGKIWVESEINKGSTFKFTVPKNIQI